MSSTSSEDEQESDADNDAKAAQFSGRNNAYKATRVFYRNRGDRQVQEATANVSGSDTDPSQARQKDNKPTKQTRTADHVTINNKHLNFNKSAKYKRDDSATAAARGKSADTVDRRDNYKYGGHERRNVSRETTKPERGNATNGGYNDNDNDKSKQQNDTDKKDASVKDGRQENDSTEDPQSATHVDNSIRYSRTRRSPRKWQLLPIPPPTYNSRPSSELASGPPTDDRRPYRRNLPPRMLAKLKQTNTPPAVTQDPVVVTSGDDGKESNVDVTQTTLEVTNGEASRQNEGNSLYL